MHLALGRFACRQIVVGQEIAQEVGKLVDGYKQPTYLKRWLKTELTFLTLSAISFLRKVEKREKTLRLVTLC